MKRRPLEAGQHPPEAALAANVLQQWSYQAEDSEREQQDHDWSQHPTQPVALDRYEEIAFDGVAQHDAKDERRARPFELLHDPADQAKEQQGEKIAPLSRGLEGADVDDAEHSRQDERVAQRRELGELRAERVAQARAQNVGQRHRPHHRIGDAEILGQHVGARHQTVDQERAEQDRHGGAAGDTEGDSRNQRAALLGIVGALRGDHAPHVALAECRAGAFLGLERMTVGEPVDDGGTNAGNGADAASDPRASHDEPPMLEAVLHALPLALVDVGRPGVGRDRDPGDQEVAQLRQRKDAEQQRRERQTIPEVKAVEGPAQRARLRIRSDHRDHDAEAAGRDSAQRRIAGQHRDHGNAEHGKGQ